MTKGQFLRKARKANPKLSLSQLNKIWDDTIRYLKNNPVIYKSVKLKSLMADDK